MYTEVALNCDYPQIDQRRRRLWKCWWDWTKTLILVHFFFILNTIVFHGNLFVCWSDVEKSRREHLSLKWIVNKSFLWCNSHDHKYKLLTMRWKENRWRYLLHFRFTWDIYICAKGVYRVKRMALLLPSILRIFIGWEHREKYNIEIQQQTHKIMINALFLCWARFYKPFSTNLSK